jgi:hypothetical protein
VEEQVDAGRQARPGGPAASRIGLGHHASRVGREPGRRTGRSAGTGQPVPAAVRTS